MWEAKTFKNQEFIPLIKTLIDLYSPESYLEVGLQKGYTFNKIAPLVSRAVGVDPKPLFTNANKNATIFTGTSVEYAKVCNDTFDLILIDGDHSRAAVQLDIDMFLHRLTQYTGLMLLHDTYPGTEKLEQPGYCNDAWKAARDVHRTFKYNNVEIVTLPGPYAGLSILRKTSNKHLHWKDKAANAMWLKRLNKSILDSTRTKN